MKPMFPSRKYFSVPGMMIFALGLLFNSCEPTDETPNDTCGAHLSWYAHLDMDLDFTTSEILPDGRITYYFEDIGTPTNICADNHITCYWKLKTKTGQEDTSLLVMRGKVYWQGLQGEVVNLEWYGTDYYKSKEVGLKMAYGDAPAWIGINMQVTIRDQGTDELNRALLKSKINDLYVQVDYEEDK
jgi:hypothetical protein